LNDAPVRAGVLGGTVRRAFDEHAHDRESDADAARRADVVSSA
jgi:hypothetical protein